MIFSCIFIILHQIFWHTVQFRAFAYEGYMDIQSTEATTKLNKTNARRSFSSSTARRQIRNQINPMHNSRKQNGIIFFPLNLTETKTYSPKNDSWMCQCSILFVDTIIPYHKTHRLRDKQYQTNFFLRRS